MQEDLEQLAKEIEPFKVDGKLTSETQRLWLQSKGILRRGTGIYINDWAIVYPDPKVLSEKEVSQRYKRMEQRFEDFITGKLTVGKMGIKKETKITTEEINAEEIPF